MFAGTTPPRQIDLITVDPAGNFLEAFRSVFRFLIIMTRIMFRS